MKSIFGILLMLIGAQSIIAEGGQPISTDDRTGLTVTVYNNDLALVKDTRKITLQRAGRQALLFIDVPENIQATSAFAANLDQAAHWQVLEQNYRYDLITSKALLSEYVGRELVLITYNNDNQVQERVRARLLAFNDQPIYQIGDNIYLDHPGSIVLPETPGNLVASPSLEWLVDAGKGTHTIQVSYLTAGLAWQADYTLQVDADYETADLSTWATVTNNSGMSYPEANLKLVAGTVNRVTPKQASFGRSMERAVAMDVAPVQREQFLDYHLFDVPGTVTIQKAQTKQIELYPPATIKVDRQYRLEIPDGYARRSNISELQPVRVHLKIANSSANKLGQPLPAGIVRVYGADRENEIQFAGESRTGAVADEENMELSLGTAFDIIGKVKVMDVVTSGSGRSQVRDVTTEASVTNRKQKKSAIVAVIPTFQEGWEILSASHKWSKLDSRRIKFELDIPAGKAMTINYKVRTK
ncbi:DUF4139 domain-containing protein [Candidatus Neomarinimicrobiota bacterium]